MRSDWKDAVIYQIYPRSFKDSNGDGIGDIRGIIDKIPYLKDLGINAVWISPMYQSPMVDFGYDVSDHCQIDPIFGSMHDFDELIKKLYSHDIKLIMDYIPNHTSNKHPWFIESSSSKHNPKRDWYVWKDPKPGGSPPNNWLCVFGGLRWTLDKKTGQYYLHTFLKEQPDLNWRNPNVVEAMFNVMKFWLEKGVDGFRVDGFELIYKDVLLRDNPRNEKYEPHMIPYMQQKDTFTFLEKELHPLIQKMQSIQSAYKNILMITETWRLSLDNVQNFYHAGTPLHFPFNMEFIFMDWDAQKRKTFIDKYDKLVGGTYLPNYVLGNHDLRRVATRYGRGAARAAAILQLTLRGVPTIYYGEELGMENVHVPPHMIQDPSELNQPGLGHGRDPVRSPMEWEAGKNAGFSTQSPWLPISSHYKTRNVQYQQSDPHSFLNLYKALIKLHTSSDVLIHGTYKSHDVGNDDVLCFTREYKNAKIVVAINFSATPARITLPGGGTKILLDSNNARVGEIITNTLSLKPEEAVVIV